MSKTSRTKGGNMYLGIDPGNEQTAYALVREDYVVIEADKVDNRVFRAYLRGFKFHHPEVCIESIQSYGMTVGRTVFETCYEIGRIIETCERQNFIWRLYPRPEYARALIGGMKIKDSLIRQALITRFGGDKKGEPLHRLKGNTDKRSAFAVAVYHIDKMRLSKASDF